ncbi:tetratricopeptide repeat protein [Streptomyces sp. NPDC048269]|uniref:tetratricopeptide repeat protein n=1 Tax=Streptomyces sp. NPDC048269 TaxID=3155753 RepID=UPI00341D8E5A
MTAMQEARQYFAAALVEAHRDAGTPSLAELEKRSKKGLTRSTVSRVLLADFVDPPPWAFVDLFLATCTACAEAEKKSVTAAFFDRAVWRRRYADLEVLWEAYRKDEEGLPPEVQPFPLKDAQPLTADLCEQPSQLLLARHEVVPFTGRVDDLAALAGWRDGKTRDGQPIAASVALLHGGGGQGKTRLAAELARRTAALGGWKVWQAARTGTTTAAAGRTRKSTLGRNALVVVDYAERWPAPELVSLLEELAARRGTRLRVLLIARSPDWWSLLLDDLRKQGYAQAEFPLESLPEGDVDARLQAFTVARERFGRALGLSKEDAETIGEPGNLDDAAYGLTLTVHMAALVAVYTHIHGGEPPRDPGALSAYLLDRERGHWSKLKQRDPDCAVPVGVMTQAVYTATLTRPRRYRAALTALKDAEVEDPASHPQVLREHAACYPPTEPKTYLEPLYPDRLGEDFVALSTPGPPAGSHLSTVWAEQAAARLLRATADFPPGTPAPEWSRDVLTNLINAAARWPHLAAGELAPLAIEHPGLMLHAGNAALVVLARIEDMPIEALEAIESAAPARDPDLDVGIAEITEIFSAERIPSASDPAAKAALYSKRAWRLSNSGRHEEALEAIEKAVELHRVLAHGGHAEQLSELAWALNGLSNELHWTGRHRAALEAAQESVALLAAVVQNRPEKIANLAVASTTLSLRLDEQGRTAQGLELLENAVRITRLTADASPADFRPDLAGMLHNLGSQLSRVGRFREALTAETEACSIYRQLAEQEPKAYTEALANALDGLANALGGLGRHREALASGEEAVGILRAGAEDNPGAYGPPLANALLNLGVSSGESGSLREAVRFCRESVAMSRELVVRSRAAHLPLLARAVMNLGIWLGESGFHGEAVGFSEEAVSLFRELVGLDSESHLPGFAESLLNLGPRLAETGRIEEGAAASREAVELYRRLSPANPVVHRRNLAITLVNLGNGLSRQRDPAAAVACFREAAVLARKVAEDNPGGGLPILASVLINLASQLNAAGLQAESLTAVYEAVAIQRSMAKADAAAHEPVLAAALVILCDGLSGVGRHQEAVTEGTQAVAILQRLAQAAPAAHRLHLALALRSLGRPLAELSRHHQAVAVGEQEVNVWRYLAQTDPVGYEFDLALALNSLVGLLAQAERHEEAVMVGEQAGALWRRLDHPVADQMLALSLSSLGRPLAALNRHEDVIAAGKEALAIWRRLAQEDPAAHRRHLVTGLFYGLGLPLAQLDRWQQAEGHLREAVDLQRRLAQEDPTTHLPQLAQLLITVVLLRIGRQHGLREALAAAEEAVEAYGALALQNPALFRAPLEKAQQLRAHLRATLPPDTEREE